MGIAILNLVLEERIFGITHKNVTLSVYFGESNVFLLIFNKIKC